MRWQRVAQAAIVIFVVGFIAVLVSTLRRGTATPDKPAPAPQREDETATLQNLGGCEQLSSAGGRVVFTIKCGKHFSYSDGRQRLVENVEVSLPRNDREFVIRADEADILPKDDGINTATFKNNVRLTSAGGLVVSGKEATYADATGVLTIPGAVEFTKGRMKGSGVNATYDRLREVLWIQEQARVTVAADPKTGAAASDASATSIGLARAEHYLRLAGNARLTSEGRTLEADDIVIRLTDDDERVRTMELRANSRITGGSGGPQSMSARDIDLAYADDGRTLQTARLIENAAVQLDAASGKRVSGRTIDIGMGPNGTTVTRMQANERVQVDLPAEGQAPAKQIRSASLAAEGPPDKGLQRATFTGNVEYLEVRLGRGNGAPSADRSARSDTLVVDTKPGFGAIDRADFRGRVTFTSGTEMTAEAPQGIYMIDKDRLDLQPGDGLPGKPPNVRDGRMSIFARTIQVTVSTRELSAETEVRTTISPQKEGAAAGKTPSMLKQEEPVNARSNRLKYNGSTSQAVYSGAVTLWQEPDTTIRADTITVDDKSGDLTATGKAVTSFVMEETDQKTATRKRTPTHGTAETFRYIDAKRLAVYEGRAHLNGPQGDVTGDRIELFMKSGANEVERAEAYATTGQVVIKESRRIATGTRLTYTAKTEEYLIVGTPVEIIEEEKGSCTRMLGSTAIFNRAAGNTRITGSGPFATETHSLKECPAGLRR
jgi:lipopolysaccharide transport protein LptA